MKSTLFLLSAATAMAAMVVLNSCRKDPLKNMTNEESRIYITNQDSSANFNTYTTFSIVDSVAVLTNQNTIARKALTDYDMKLIATVTAHMQQSGYTLINKAAKPDLAVNLTRIDNSFTNITYNPGWWGGFGYWDPGYWGFPSGGWYWPSYYTIYRVNEKQVVIDLFDLKNPKNNKLTAVWNALWRGTGVWNINNIDAMVQASFAQSPYLNKNK